MKRISVFLVLLLSAILLHAQNFDWLWAQQASGIGSDVANAIATDTNGNSYVTGYISDICNFGSTSLVSSGVKDIFIAKIDTNSNWLWAHQAGGTGWDEGMGIATDINGNCYVTGTFNGTATFGSNTLISSGGENIFVAKLDCNGNWQWVKQAGGNSGDRSYSIAVDDLGNCYLTGNCSSDASFGNFIAEGNLFVAKLKSNGDWEWVESAGGYHTSEGLGVAVDADSNCYVTGCFEEWITLGSTVLQCGMWEQDIVVAKIDSNGNWLWAKKAGGESNDGGWSIATDVTGNIYVTGWFRANATIGSVTLTCSGDFNMFVAKIDRYGNWLWAKQSFGADMATGTSVTLDAVCNCYVSGFYIGAVTFDNYALPVGEGIFVVKLDSNGNWLWAKKSEGEGYPHDYFVSAISIDAIGNCYIAGDWCNPFNDFQNAEDISVAKMGLIEVANEDNLLPSAYLALLGNYPNPFSTKTAIKYVLEEPAPVKIDIYNLKGQLVNSLVNESKAAGTHTAEWNGLDINNHKVANGIYYYTLTTRNHKSTRKLIMMR